MLPWSMPRRVLAVLALALMFFISAPGAPAAAQTPDRQADVPRDVLLLVDVTLSMATRQGEGSVWTETSASVTTLLDRLAAGTNVALVPFDAGPRLSLIYPPVAGETVAYAALAPDTARALQTHLAELPVDGQGTHIYESVEFALGVLARWRSETPDVTRVQTLVLYTDGEDTGPHGSEGVLSLAALVDEALQAKPSLAVVYHDVANVLDESDRRVLTAAGVQVITSLPPPVIEIGTRRVDLGQVEEGATATFELGLTSAFADVFGRSVEASIVGSAAVTLIAAPAKLSPNMQFTVSFSEGGSPDASVELVLRSLEAEFVTMPASVILQFDHSPTPVLVAAASEAPGSPAEASQSSEPQRQRRGAILGATATALLGLGAVLIGGVLLRHRRTSHTTFHRLLLRHGAEPNSLLDPESRLITLTVDDLEPRGPRGPGDEGEREGWRNPDLERLLQHAVLTLQDGELHVRPLNMPLFIGTEPVPTAGQRVRAGELLRAGELYVRYDRYEVK